MAQTPKEKAEEIFYKMLKYSFGSQEKSALFQAKQCSLIAVDEIISNIEPSVSIDIISARITYWKQVKEEINKL